MRCPKCGCVNPDDGIFCEECDHRMDQPVRGDAMVLTLMYIIIAALALGVSAAVSCFFTKDMWYLPVGFGAVGLLLGSYSLTVVRRTVGIGNKTVPMVLSGTAMVLSVIGFAVGMTLI